MLSDDVLRIGHRYRLQLLEDLADALLAQRHASAGNRTSPYLKALARPLPPGAEAALAAMRSPRPCLYAAD